MSLNEGKTAGNGAVASEYRACILSYPILSYPIIAVQSISSDSSTYIQVLQEPTRTAQPGTLQQSTDGNHWNHWSHDVCGGEQRGCAILRG